ncbi:TetR/AcrR family transcriptional regulator [Brachybacterium hainanense]|uniref:TetR/AcrR family transcriptional regulator n=1 Tax=Brachybacterium hainanense TaxID=1541174 RepID=A0ABV6RA31_9MICO
MSIELQPSVPAPGPSTAAGEAILDAASALFSSRGIAATGVDLIAARAGVTKRTLYQRFGSKEALLADCLRRRMHAWQAHVLDELDAAPAMPPALAIRTVFAAARDWTRDPRRGCSFLAAWPEVAVSPGDAATLVRQEEAWMRSLFTVLTGDAATGELVHQLYAGAQICAAIDDDPDAMDRAADAAAHIVRGARERASASASDGPAGDGRRGAAAPEIGDATQYISPMPLLSAIAARTQHIEVGAGAIEIRQHISGL